MTHLNPFLQSRTYQHLPLFTRHHRLDLHQDLEKKKLDLVRYTNLKADSPDHSLTNISPPLQTGSTTPTNTTPLQRARPLQKHLHIDLVWN